MKVADFGTARLCSKLKTSHNEAAYSQLPPSRTLTRGVGTLLWCAPEVLCGGQYNHLADVYSYGVVLWEILTRRIPWEHLKKTWDVSTAVEDGQRPAFPEGTPPHVSEFISRCWCHDIEQRPEFSEIVARLRDQPLWHGQSSTA